MSATSSPKSVPQDNALFTAPLRDTDPEIAEAIGLELSRQRDEIELIASENIVSRSVLEAQGSVLTNKYAEGLPGKRYYGGAASTSILPSAWRSSASPNCSAASSPMCSRIPRLRQRGSLLCAATARRHLHGAQSRRRRPSYPRFAVNMSGKWFKPVPYGVRREDQRIDMDEVAKLAREHRPKLIVAGGSAYPRIIDFKRFREICDEVGAYLFVDMAHFAGLVAGGAHPSPFPHAHVVTTTTTHKTLRGPRGGVILSDDEEIAKKLNSAVFPACRAGR